MSTLSPSILKKVWAGLEAGAVLIFYPPNYYSSQVVYLSAGAAAYVGIDLAGAV